MPPWVTEILASQALRRLFTSLVVVAAVVAIRVVGRRWIQRGDAFDPSERLRWNAYLRTLGWIVLALGLLFIWGQELREFAISLVAIVAAIVLATKELLMCITGSLQRATSGSFRIGDRIEVAGIRGDVIKHSLLSTTLLEIGPSHQRTGRTQVIPNSVFLSQPVGNETFTEAYVLHSFGVPVKRETDWQASERELLAAANAVSGEHVDAANRHMGRVSEANGLPPFGVEPRVTVRLDEADKITLLVRVPTPARERGRNEQRILRRFLGATED